MATFLAASNLVPRLGALLGSFSAGLGASGFSVSPEPQKIRVRSAVLTSKSKPMSKKLRVLSAQSKTVSKGWVDL